MRKGNEMLKTTSRYKLNKMISESRLTDISFCLDVGKQNLNEVCDSLRELTENTSITFIVAVANKSPKGYL